MSFRLASLTSKLLIGELPDDWDGRACQAAGEALRDLVDNAVTAEKDRDELELIEQILIDYGALAPDDKTTGLADLLEVLLPHIGG